MSPGLFHPDAFDVVVGRFPDDTGLFPQPRPDDQIAFLFDRAFDLVARTGRSLRLASAEGRRSLREGAAAFYRLDNVDLLMRLRDFIDESLPWTFEEENVACLGFLRNEYRARVRGQKACCWEGLLRGLADDLPGCALERECRGNGSGGARPSESACRAYQSGWRASALALADLPAAGGDEVLGRLYEACPCLRVLADRHELRSLLAGLLSCGAGATRDRRSVRGIPVRVLSDLLEHLLRELSLRLELPPSRTYHLTGSGADKGPSAALSGSRPPAT